MEIIIVYIEETGMYFAQKIAKTKRPNEFSIIKSYGKTPEQAKENVKKNWDNFFKKRG
jgi:hypothetical protein